MTGSHQRDEPRTGATVSCVLPAHNAAPHLRGAIDSILGQHRGPPLEVIVADDGSTDSTAAIAKSYGDLVRVVTEPVGGPAATRNLGIRAARGEFIGFLDPDDRWHPDKLSLQMSRFDAHPDLDCSVGHVQMFWEEGHSTEEERYRQHSRMDPVPGYATTTLLARRSAFARVGLLDPALWFADATEWFLRARRAGVTIELIPDVLVFHRLHGTNLTRRREEASREEFLRLVKVSLDRRRGCSGA